ncbi:hypothetical protein BaRGS_00030856 [Batillaria attramentaria]|uniref:Uncharacterized protein n=1 Tax=Batillaria attramentaria TaxID=370345 RepID=A0ABD0JS07_9CAEN
MSSDTVCLRESCPLFFWTYACYKRDNSPGPFTRCNMLRPSTFVSTCVAVFIVSSLLMQCGDVGQNAGPGDTTQGNGGDSGTPGTISPTPTGNNATDNNVGLLASVQTMMQ